MTKIIGHRGASAYEVENTIPAFSAALDQGADGLELDVHFSADGHIVVFHDFNLKSLTGDNGFIFEKTLEELKSMACKSHGKTGVIPTLEEVLVLIVEFQKKSTKEILLNVEFKAGSDHYPGIEEKTLELCLKFLKIHQLIFSSFDHYALQMLRNLSPELRLGILTASAIVDPWLYVDHLKADFYHPHYLTLSDRELKRVREHNLKVISYTVNDLETAKKLMAQGLYAIITDMPDKMLALRASESYKK
ncbi:MAG: glycerophosphodiester phosphodiesterase [Clostridia bacterium]|nr:glycerophosphodiester phosphodiesterase [Clostridia bacterium]